MPPPLPSLSTSLFPSLPPPHPSTTLQPIFGVPPSVHVGLLHDMYAAQIGAIVFEGTEEGTQSRPVLLGIALKGLGSGAGEEEEAGVSEEERRAFGEVMEMVVECKVW